MSKVIKLNRRYKLYKEHGCTHAIKFSGWTTDVAKVEQFFRERYGSDYSWNKPTMWKTHWAKANGRFNSRSYFIGVKDEEMIFVAKLAGAI
jgi:hypothetical protein